MIRKANLNDPEAIRDLVNTYAARELMLPRALNEVYEDLRDFFVYEVGGRILGCAALHVCWEGLGEVRSLAVAEDMVGRGIGRQLVEACLGEARVLGMGRVFVLTYVPEFFRRFGFREYPKEQLPHKVWTDCLKCHKFPNCDEIAMLIELDDGRFAVRRTRSPSGDPGEGDGAEQAPDAQ
jgi:amino-acid N-acetyltransferase